DFGAGGRLAARKLLAQMHGGEGDAELRASHDPASVFPSLLTAILQRIAGGAGTGQLAQWESGFSDEMLGYTAIAQAERQRGRPANRRNLLSSTATAPISGVLSDRTQLAMVGIATVRQLHQSARTATLDQCRELGREQ